MHPAIVVGAGPAGLATSYALTRAGLDHLVLEAGEVGQTWASLYDSLVLHTGKHMSALPGLAFSRSMPLFPSRAQFLDYLRHYAATHALPIRTGARVTTVARDGDGWTLHIEQTADRAESRLPPDRSDPRRSRDRAPGHPRVAAHGVRFADGREDAFDVVLPATGYRPALGPLDGLVQRDACGFARRRDHVVSLDRPDLYFVGQTYDACGALFNIGRDAQRVARVIARTRRAP